MTEGSYLTFLSLGAPLCRVGVNDSASSPWLDRYTHLKRLPAPRTWEALTNRPATFIPKDPGASHSVGAMGPRKQLLSLVSQSPKLFKCVWGWTVLGAGRLYTAALGRNKKAAGLPESLSAHPRAPVCPENREVSSFLSSEPGECEKEGLPCSPGPTATARQLCEQIR